LSPKLLVQLCFLQWKQRQVIMLYLEEIGYTLIYIYVIIFTSSSMLVTNGSTKTAYEDDKPFTMNKDGKHMVL